ncbi:MAG: hypothetical protein ACRC6R_07040 [Bacteroidales bacterium]
MISKLQKIGLLSIMMLLSWPMTITADGIERHENLESLELMPELISTRDTIDIIRTRAIGRFDRHITNYRFIPQKKWIGGVTFSYVNYESSESSILFSLLKDFTSNARTLKFRPYIGYALRDNVVIGMEFGYNHTVANLDNISLKIDDDLDFTMSGIRLTEDLYTIATFHRSYVGLDPGKRFGLFNETALTYKKGTASFARTQAEQPKRTDTDIQEINLGINPGVSVFIMQNVSAEVSFGIVGFKYRSEKQRNTLGEEGSRRSSGANFKINLFNINLGISVCI